MIDFRFRARVIQDIRDSEGNPQGPGEELEGHNSLIRNRSHNKFKATLQQVFQQVFQLTTRNPLGPSRKFIRGWRFVDPFSWKLEPRHDQDMLFRGDSLREQLRLTGQDKYRPQPVPSSLQPMLELVNWFQHFKPQTHPPKARICPPPIPPQVLPPPFFFQHTPFGGLSEPFRISRGKHGGLAFSSRGR